MAGADLITEERLRQVAEEGRTAEHDDEHAGGELAYAALGYLEAAISQPAVGGHRFLPSFWPRPVEDWRSSADPIRNLTKAGALIAAEIDRLERQSKGHG